jgi:signal transduction histidine kinase/CheY-like chemotaxis protein/CHASE3 domain sensor protein/HPt (histidine-containing phosphotransfer) domain-containing protein
VKKNTIHIKIGFLLILAVLLLSATCYLSYRNLSSIAASIRVDFRPESILLTIREISEDLEKADNSVRIYTITKDTIDLQPYYSVISGIDRKMNDLRRNCAEDPVILAHADTISSLIGENIITWNEILYLSHNDRVNENLKNLSAQLESAADSNQRKEKGILKRVFNKDKKDQMNEEEIILNLQKIEQEDRMAEEKMMESEASLGEVSSDIQGRFFDLINEMETEVSRLIRLRAQKAGQLADQTYNWLIMFAVSGGLLAVVILFILIRYTGRTHASQQALRTAKEEAEKLAGIREMFMANMSHEIRTPVTAISGFTEQLLNETSDSEKVRILKIIKSSSDHLVRLINDILDFSKLQSGKLVLEKEHFSIYHVMEDVQKMFERQAQLNNNSLSYSIGDDTPPVLLGDPYRLKQVMLNLVGNAVKFTSNGEINFTVRSIPKSATDIDLVTEVADTGIGMDEENQKIIFEDFTQAEKGISRKYGGTGLGLSIVRKIVDLHHGRIECESRKGYGTRITCLLPYTVGDERQMKQEMHLPPSVPEKIKNLRILIVDDEAYNRMLFKKILDHWNVRYEEATNGKEAVEKLKVKKYDLLLLDNRMPEMDGLKATKYIRNELKISDSELPIVCISAASGDEREYLNAGMNGFIRKPFTEEKLLSVIMDLTEKHLPVYPSVSPDWSAGGPFKPEKINLQNLYRISGGDGQFVKQMLESFIHSTKTGLDEMEKAASSSRWDMVAALAHKLSAPCRHIGALDLFDLLVKIEKLKTDKERTQGLSDLIGKARKDLEEVTGLINGIIAKMD